MYLYLYLYLQGGHGVVFYIQSRTAGNLPKRYNFPCENNTLKYNQRKTKRVLAALYVTPYHRIYITGRCCHKARGHTPTCAHRSVASSFGTSQARTSPSPPNVRSLQSYNGLKDPRRRGFRDHRVSLGHGYNPGTEAHTYARLSRFRRHFSCLFMTSCQSHPLFRLDS